MRWVAVGKLSVEPFRAPDPVFRCPTHLIVAKRVRWSAPRVSTNACFGRYVSNSPDGDIGFACDVTLADPKDFGRWLFRPQDFRALVGL